MQRTDATNKNNDKIDKENIDEENSDKYDKIINVWKIYSQKNELKQEKSAESNYEAIEEFMTACQEEDRLKTSIIEPLGFKGIEKIFMHTIEQSFEPIDPKKYDEFEILAIYKYKALANALWIGEEPTYTNETIDQVIKKIDKIIENIENVQDPVYKKRVDYIKSEINPNPSIINNFNSLNIEDSKNEQEIPGKIFEKIDE
jgi:hypothetical protein